MSDDKNTPTTQTVPESQAPSESVGVGRFTSGIGRGTVEGIVAGAVSIGVGAGIAKLAHKKMGGFAKIGGMVGGGLGAFHGTLAGAQQFDAEQARLAQVSEANAARENALQATINRLEEKGKYADAIVQEKEAAAAAANSTDKARG